MMKTKPGNKRLNKSLTALCAAVILLGFTTGSVLAVDVSDEDYKTLQIHKKKEAEQQLPPHKRPAPAEPAGNQHANLAEAATNPIANLMQFQLQNRYAWDSHNSDGYANTFILQPVIPFGTPFKKAPILITRTTLPYVSTPDLDSPVHRKHGFGDLTFLGIFNGALSKGQSIGAGASLVFPTAGDNDFTGSGKYQAGPAFIYINTQTPRLQWGILGWQHWSYASGGSSGSDREDVSELSWQPFIIKHFDKGWYVGTHDEPQKYDFKANGFTWNLGVQVGKVMKLGKLPVKLFVEPGYNPNAAGGSPSRWTVTANLTMLFPK
jgi:hypothetical protein